MNTNIHIKSGSPIYIETYDLYEGENASYTQLIKIKGVDDNGGKFDITLFGNDGLQSPISIENMDKSVIRINGSEINNDSFVTIKEEVENAE